mmetsp:Transcript_7483/g.20852  ORF Transcript_7483/g.20852 Transcript_7483/m.20852 type:complete len:373 (+) Transcript_7483:142-1260(+)|eukprot:CAMPEP_0181048062 /NCGR_PEP_ID=MMETSP1070-20121207/15227_1 /TAXON_ID=265543 /ORGANISM="Minutocellus polymorphus, Strain NH13" /LENGTH=372 /DNA_ID=CAMNT_0023126805 /DNA_START=201 /DNA_END=1319 /DNA_ORIENTATION=-
MVHVRSIPAQPTKSSIMAPDIAYATGQVGRRINELRTSSYAQEWYLQLLVPIVFGLILSFIGLGVVFFSYLENNLLRRYKDEGKIVRGEVMSRQLVRGEQRRNDVDEASRNVDTATFAASIHYFFDLADNYPVKIRKQLKIKEGDLIIGYGKGDTCNADNDAGQNRKERGRVPSLIDLSAISASPRDLTKCKSQEYYTESIDLYILPEFLRSGYPKAQVDERTSSHLFRVWTNCVICLPLCMALGCFVYSICVAKGNSNVQVSLLAIVVISLFLEFWFIKDFLRESFQEALRQEYLESGDFISIPRDNSTVSMVSSAFWSDAGSGSRVGSSRTYAADLLSRTGTTPLSTPLSSTDVYTPSVASEGSSFRFIL